MQSKHDFILQRILPGKCKTGKDKAKTFFFVFFPQQTNLECVAVLLDERLGNTDEELKTTVSQQNNII